MRDEYTRLIFKDLTNSTHYGILMKQYKKADGIFHKHVRTYLKDINVDWLHREGEPRFLVNKIDYDLLYDLWNDRYGKRIHDIV